MSDLVPSFSPAANSAPTPPTSVTTPVASAAIPSAAGSLSTAILDVGFSGFGSFSLSGSGSLSISNELELDPSNTGTASFNATGGTLSAPIIHLAKNSTLTISGASVTAIVNLIVDNTSSSVLTLNSGILSVGSLSLNGVPGHFTWNSGTLNFLGNVTVNSSFALGSSIALGNGKIFMAQSLTNQGIITLANPSALSLFSVANAANASITGAGNVSLISKTPSANAGLLSISGTFQSSADFANFGTFSLAGPQTWASGATFTNSGNATFSSDTGSTSASPLNIINTAGSIHLHATQHLNSLTLNGGALFVETGTTKVNALSIAGTTSNWSATLNLGSNPFILEAAANKSSLISTLQNQLVYGLTHTTGIVGASLSAHQALALLDNAVTNFATFGGISVDTNSLLISPELLGDANADGHVDLTDLSTLLNHFGQQTPNWTDGNFDNAPTIDLTDLSDVLNNFGLTNPNASSQLLVTSYQLPSTPTPEPTSLVLLLPTLLLGRRRHA